MLWEYIKESMLKHSNQTVCENSAKLTFEELVVWVECFSKRLEGIRCCAILCKSEMAAAMALLCCFAARVTAVPLSERYGALHCNKIIKTISPDAVLSDEDGKLQIRKITDSTFDVPKTHPALIMCTSGTTGEPKGVMLSEENIISNVKDISEYFRIGTDDTILIPRPLYHCAVLTGEFLVSLIKGTRIRFFSELFNPPKILDLVDKYEITVLCGTPTLFGMMVRFLRQNRCNSLKSICISGECMDRQTGSLISSSFPHRNIYHVYGLTEACPRVSYLPPELFERHPECVGIALKSISMKIVKGNGEIAKVGEEGVLWIKGKNVMIGYYKNINKTREVLNGGWLCTGDLAIIDSNGLLTIKGRNDHLIIKSGMNIYPSEVEAAIRADDRVKEVLVYGIKKHYGTQIGMKIAGEFSSVEEVKRLCVKHLPVFQIPSIIEIVDEIPKNGSGKMIRS